jgi:hypothetical protein
MTIIEIRQGWSNDLTGTPKDEALAALVKAEADFLEKYPHAAQYHRPGWSERTVDDWKTAPWGYVWYQVDEAGLLKMHSAQYDSSG